MVEIDDVPPEFVAGLRAICLALPDAYEERAWVGVRWRVRTRTFAHVLMIDGGRPQAIAVAAGSDGPLVVLTFRAPGEELDAFAHSGPPFFYGGWGRDAVGMRLDPTVDWAEVRELLTESYCLLAPRKLASQVMRPG
jgi:hypothetical protein